MISRPIIIVCPPRSGSSLLFETLLKSPDLWTVGGESHSIIEGIPALHPAARRWESNRLGAADADPRIIQMIRRRFQAAVRDRDGRRPRRLLEVRLLEKTPRNCLRIPFLRAIFPRATFVYLYRAPAETMSSMLDGWRSGRYVSYRSLPGWSGLPWSFLLVPKWRSLPPHALASTVAHQWAMATSILINDLQAVPAEQRCTVYYDDLVANPRGVVTALCRVLGLRWDKPITGPLPLSSTTLAAPAADKWRSNAAELEGMLVATAEVSERARLAAGCFRLGAARVP